MPNWKKLIASGSDASLNSLNVTGGLTAGGTITANSFNGNFSGTVGNNLISANQLNVTGNGTTSQFLRSDGDGTFTWATPTNTNYFLNGITKSGNTLTFSVSGTTNRTYTFGSNAFTSYSNHVGLYDSIGSADAVNSRIDEEVLPAIPTNNNQLTNGAGYTTNVGDITGVTAGVGLSGGGSSGGVTLTLDMSELTDMTAAMVGTDEFIVLDGGADRRKAASEIGLSIFSNDAGFITDGNTGWNNSYGFITATSTDTLTNKSGNISMFTNDAGYTTNVGDITGVTAGSGLTGGGTSGTVTVSHADTSTQSSVNNSGRTYIQDITLDTYGHITGITSATETVVNTDTNTQRTDDEIREVTKTQLVNGDNVTLSVEGDTIVISSTDTNTTYSVGDGGLTQKNFTTTLFNKLNGIAAGANNYSLPEATSTVRGGIELFSNTDQSVAANTVSATAGRTYGIQLNSAGQAVVNVPWSDTNTNTTYSAGTGLTLSGTTFSLTTPITNNNQLTNGAGYQTSAQVNTAIQAVVDAAPAALDTLNEIAASLNDDSDFAGTMTTALAGKLSTTGKAADSNLLDGLDLGGTRANVANKVVRTDSSGYTNFGWINTTSGNTTNTITDFYVNTNDGYIRKATPAHVKSQLGLGSAAYVNTSAFDSAGSAAEVNTRIEEEVLPAIPTNNNQLTNGAGYTTNTGTMSSWIIKEGNGTETTTITNGETFTIEDGTGIQSELTSTTSGGTITITNTAPDQTVSLTGAGATSISGTYPNFTITSTDTNTDTNTQRTDEEIRDVAAAQWVNGTNTTVVKDDANNTIKINSTNTNTQRSDVEIREVTKNQLVAGDNVTLSEEGETIVISSTDTNTNTTYSAGTGLTLSGTTFSLTNTYDNYNGWDLFTDGTSRGRITTGENVNFVGGSNVSLSYSSTNNTITINSTDTNTNTNYFLNGITKSGNTLTFSVSGTTNRAYTFGSNAFTSYSNHVGLYDSIGSAAEVNTRIDEEVIPAIPTNNNQLTNGAGYITSYVNTVDMGDGFIIEDGDGTEVRITENKEVKFVEGTGIDINWTDTSNGSDGDPYDLRITNTAPDQTVSLTGAGATTISGTYPNFTITSTDTNTDTNTTYSAGTGLTLSGTTFSLTNTYDNYVKWQVSDGITNTNVTSGDRVTFIGGGATNISYDAEAKTFTITSTDTNTDTNTTYSADGNYGMTLSGTTFRLEDDRRRNSTTTDIYTGNTHDFTFYDASVGIRWYTAGSEDMRLYDNGTLHVDGDVIAYSTTISDERLKDNITTIENPLDKIKALRGVEYDWNSGSRKGKRDLGLIAQEVEKVIPNIVHEHDMPLMDGAETDTLYKTVDYEKMVAVLIEGMKEQQSQIDELKSEISKLKGEA